MYDGFVVKEVDKLDPAIGTIDDLKYFVNEAHKRNIRVFFDVVPPGVSTDSSLVADHHDWFHKGNLVLTWGFSYDFDWNVREDREYYINEGPCPIAGNRGIMIIPNNGERSTTLDVTVPFKDMGLDGGIKYTLTNLMTGKMLGTGTKDQLEKL